MDVEQLKQDVREGRVDVDRLVDLVGTLQRRLSEANQRIRELEEKLGGATGAKVDEPFSLKAEEKRQEARGRKAKQKKQKRVRRGRLATADKLKLAEQEEDVFPEGVDPQQCRFSHSRPVWRLDNAEYRRLADRLLEIYYAACRVQRDGRLGDAGRARKAAQLDDEVLELCGPAVARKTGRTNKTRRGARRQTVLTSVLESLRLHLPDFTLSSVLEEMRRWTTRGRSCFSDLLRKLKLQRPEKSILDTLLPLPTD